MRGGERRGGDPEDFQDCIAMSPFQCRAFALVVVVLRAVAHLGRTFLRTRRPISIRKNHARFRLSLTQEQQIGLSFTFPGFPIDKPICRSWVSDNQTVIPVSSATFRALWHLPEITDERNISHNG